MLIIIQARTSSKRFKNKVLYKIYGKTLIEHVIDKIKKSRNAKIVVATSKNKDDDKLAKFLKKKKINYYRGSLLNVAERLFHTAKMRKKNFFMRISGDSPLIDFKLINKMSNLHKKKRNIDLMTNVFPRTFPSGQSIEIIKTNTLGENLRFFSKLDKEHVTRYFYKNPKKFKIFNIKNKKKESTQKHSIDTLKELKRICQKFSEKKFLQYSYLNEKN